MGCSTTLLQWRGGQGWEPRRKGGQSCMDGGSRGVGKQDLQGGGKREI